MPELSVANSPVCAAWDPELELQVGLIDNDVIDPITGFDHNGDGTVDAEDLVSGGVTSDDGIDLGWVTSSTAVMTVKHIFSGVANGDNYSVSGKNSAKGSDKLLAMDKVVSADTATYNDNEAYGDAIQIRQDDDVAADGTNPVDDPDNPSACVPTTGAFSYAATIGGNQQPDNCFRLRVVGDATAKNPKLSNYLDGYTVEVAAADSEVAWGKVAWDPDPFEGLECEPMVFVAADQLDICAMFEDEVDRVVADGWDSVGAASSGRLGNAVLRSKPRTSEGNADTTDGSVLNAWFLHTASANRKPDRFKTLWFDDNLDSKIRNDSPERLILYNPTDGDELEPFTGTLNDLYDDNGGSENAEYIWQYFVDEDNDPVYGDVGKVDLYSRTESADDFSDTLCQQADGPGCGDDQEPQPDGMADNYQGRAAEECDPDDGGKDACDAEWSEDFEVLFADGIFGCSTTRSVTVSCEWDAQGQLQANPPDVAEPDLFAPNPNGPGQNHYNFLRCISN